MSQSSQEIGRLSCKRHTKHALGHKEWTTTGLTISQPTGNCGSREIERRECQQGRMAIIGHGLEANFIFVSNVCDANCNTEYQESSWLMLMSGPLPMYTENLE